MKFGQIEGGSSEVEKNIETKESKDSILEKSKAERLAQLLGISKRVVEAADQLPSVPSETEKMASRVRDWIPLSGNIKMTKEAWNGETFAGEKLSPLTRAAYGITVTASYLSWVLSIYGLAFEDKRTIKPILASSAVSNGIFYGQYAIDTLISAGKKAEQYIDDKELLARLKSPDEVWNNMHTIA